MNTQKEINDRIINLEQVKPPMRAFVHDLPKEAEANTIYILQQEWVVVDDKWVRLS